MIKENQKLLNQLHILTDCLCLFLAMSAAYFFRFYILRGEDGHMGFAYYLKAALCLLPLFLLLYGMFGLYESFRSKNFEKELTAVSKATLVGTLLFLAVLFIFKIVDFSRLTLIFFYLANVFFVVLKRFFLRRFLRNLRKKGYNAKHVLLLGSGRLAQEYIDTLARNKALGFEILGYVSTHQGLRGIKKLGTYEDLEFLLEKLRPDETVAALEINDFPQINHIIQICEKNGTRLSLIPFYSKYIPARPYIDEIDGLPLINIRKIPLDNLGNALLKRSLDVLGSLGLIILSSPLMVLVALLVKISSPGPVIFAQQRIGLHKEPFIMYKFRSMAVNPKEDIAWTTVDDPRKTKIGSFLRKFSLDELPQFFNVLKGDMSLVGPRPEIPHFVEKFKENVPLYMVKHQVRPGITGWAQVNGFRGDTSIKGRIEHDIYYIENWSLLFDLKILFLTFGKEFINSEKIAK